mgnify:FL=1
MLFIFYDTNFSSNFFIFSIFMVATQESASNKRFIKESSKNQTQTTQPLSTLKHFKNLDTFIKFVF